MCGFAISWTRESHANLTQSMATKSCKCETRSTYRLILVEHIIPFSTEHNVNMLKLVKHVKTQCCKIKA